MLRDVFEILERKKRVEEEDERRKNIKIILSF